MPSMPVAERVCTRETRGEPQPDREEPKFCWLPTLQAKHRFFTEVVSSLLLHTNFDAVKCVLVAGPGFVKVQPTATYFRAAFEQSAFSRHLPLTTAVAQFGRRLPTFVLPSTPRREAATAEHHLHVFACMDTQVSFESPCLRSVG